MMKNGGILLLAVSLSLGGCATTDGPRTAVQKAVGQCVLSVGGGAAAGAAISAVLGGDAGDGAIAGGVAGAGVCGFLLYRASEEDKARIRELELASLNNDELGITDVSFTAANGKDTVNVQTITAEVPDDALPANIQFAVLGQEEEAVNVEATVTGEDSELEPTYDRCRYVTQNMTITSVDDDEAAPESFEGSRQLTCRTQTGDWVNF